MFKFYLVSSFLFFNYLFSDDIDNKNVFQDWQFYCENDNCEIRQLAIDQNNQEIVSYISLVINDNNFTQMTIGFPHFTNLKFPAIASIDEGAEVEILYTYCNHNGCFIAEVISENYLKLLLSGSSLKFQARMINEQIFTVVYSLKGITNAYNHLLNSS